MRHAWLPAAAALCVVCLANVPARAQRSLPAPSPPTAPLAPGGARVPQIPFQEFYLPNGMHVILSQDHSLPVVTESMLFNAGARDEQPGHSGFAHLFEHLMFEGSKDAPKGVFDHLVEGYGGSDNASTHEDYTYYFETVPSNALPLVMWLDADRIASLDVTEQNMKNQIAVVEEELRMRVDNAPYGPLLYVDLRQAAFSNWTNAHPVIGTIANLNQATLGEVQAFFDSYYAPRNCTLTIVGDIDPDQTEQMVRHYFSWIPNRGTPSPVNYAEPPRVQEVTRTVHDAQAKLPAVAIAWQGPPRDSPAFYALTILGNLLTDGESSRLYQSMVKGSQTAIEIDGGLGFPDTDYTDYKQPGLFTILAITKPNVPPAQVQQLIFQPILDIEANGVPDAEMSRLKTKFAADWMRSEQTTLDRGQLLSLAALLDGNAAAANSELPNFLAVTSNQIADAARQYLTHERATVVIDVPGPAPAGGGGGARPFTAPQRWASPPFDPAAVAAYWRSR